ncbi:hypothetical protein E2C01_042521 [Portunus trituberculatus]|uniref:Uncharacterized protein n=1 Tax=Portunus trituberculatus TaxID=210409 RepID=A0A5B7FV11_PORTR|nr:hypothetical protein [Portunus trituberculatus]
MVVVMRATLADNIRAFPLSHTTLKYHTWDLFLADHAPPPSPPPPPTPPPPRPPKSCTVPQRDLYRPMLGIIGHGPRIQALYCNGWSEKVSSNPDSRIQEANHSCSHLPYPPPPLMPSPGLPTTPYKHTSLYAHPLI